MKQLCKKMAAAAVILLIFAACSYNISIYPY